MTTSHPLSGFMGRLWAAFRTLPGIGVAKQDRRIQLQERLWLNPQVSLNLVQVDGRSVLLAASPTSVTVVEQDTFQRTLEKLS